MGSGIGRLEGLYGLIIDSLLSVRIMLPNTTVVEASAETNPDLFWGIRGAGVNFGFVLNATYRVYDEVPNGQHFSADFELPYTASRAFYQALKEEGPKMQAPLCITTTLQWVPKRNDVLTSRNRAAYRCKMKSLISILTKDNHRPHSSLMPYTPVQRAKDAKPSDFSKKSVRSSVKTSPSYPGMK